MGTTSKPKTDVSEDVKYLEANIVIKDGKLTAIASTNAVDRHGEVVDNNGWDLKSYKQNPVILWAHDHNEPAIGVSDKTWVEGTGKQAQLKIQPNLHEVTDTARAIKQLVDKGIIKTLSVGFRPLESPDGVTFTKNELLEVSFVNVPANADAMMLAYKSLKKSGFKDETIKEVGIEPQLIDKIVTMEKDIEDLKKSQVKVVPINPDKPKTEKNLMALKIIARASDKYLADSKQSPTDAKKTILIIKKATELLTVAEKSKLNG